MNITKTYVVLFLGLIISLGSYATAGFQELEEDMEAWGGSVGHYAERSVSPGHKVYPCRVDNQSAITERGTVNFLV